MTLTLDAVIASIEDVLTDEFVEAWYEEGIPTYSNLHLVGGKVKPYIVVSYGDLSEGFDKSMAGARGNAHDLPVRFFAVAPDAKTARKIRNEITGKFTGFTPDHCAEMRKRGGGGLFTVVNDNNVVVAYVAAVNFRTSLTLFDVL